MFDCLVFTMDERKLCFLTLLLFVLQVTYLQGDDGALVLVDADPEPDASVDVDVETADNDKNEPFYPTNEWQVVHDNQAVPAGLHVRMNLQTGVKEAKLMDGDDGARFKAARIDNLRNFNRKVENHHVEKDKLDSQYVYSGPNIVMGEEYSSINNVPSSDEHVFFTKDQLKEALKEFRDKVGSHHVTESGDIVVSEEDKLAEDVRQEKVRKKFRSIEEIRADLEHAMGWKIKSDFESMRDYISVLLRDNVTTADRLHALANLEDYVHQVDNARDLDTVGGLALLVNLLNHSESEVKEAAANVIGAAVQSNPVAQSAVLSDGAVPHLLQMLSRDQSKPIIKKGLYALSALVRGHKEAQKELIRLRGLDAVRNVIRNGGIGTLRVKAVTLLTDLIVEQNEAMLELIRKHERQEGDLSPLMAELMTLGWCEDVAALLRSSTDVDSTDRLLLALSSSLPACKPRLSQSAYTDIFRDVADRLGRDADAETDSDYKSYLATVRQTAQTLLAHL